MNYENVRNIAPFINVIFTITSKWWTERVNPVTGQTEIHRGLDIATGANDPVYSMLDGRVIDVGNTSSAGNYIIIANDNPSSGYFGFATRYLHLKDLPSLNVGDRVIAGQQVAVEGATGQATGIHLHVEMQNIYIHNWTWYFSNNKNDYIDPTLFMGIDNIQGTRWLYTGQPHPYSSIKKKFPWFIYARKLRLRRM